MRSRTRHRYRASGKQSGDKTAQFYLEIFDELLTKSVTYKTPGFSGGGGGGSSIFSHLRRKEGITDDQLHAAYVTADILPDSGKMSLEKAQLLAEALANP